MTKELEALNNIAITFDEMGMTPQTLTDSKNEIFMDWFKKDFDVIEKGLERLEQFDKYLTDLYEHRNSYKKKVYYDFEIDNAVIRASTIEELYNKFKEVLGNDI